MAAAFPLDHPRHLLRRRPEPIVLLDTIPATRATVDPSTTDVDLTHLGRKGLAFTYAGPCTGKGIALRRELTDLSDGNSDELIEHVLPCSLADFTAYTVTVNATVGEARYRGELDFATGRRGSDTLSRRRADNHVRIRREPAVRSLHRQRGDRRNRLVDPANLGACDDRQDRRSFVARVDCPSRGPRRDRPTRCVRIAQPGRGARDAHRTRGVPGHRRRSRFPSQGSGRRLEPCHRIDAQFTQRRRRLACPRDLDRRARLPGDRSGQLR